MTITPDAQGLEPLRAMQRALEAMYRLQTSIDVAEFVTTDADWAHALLGASEQPIGESVFVRSQGDDLDLSVYLDATVLERLAAAETDTDGGPPDLNDLCIALEGVSHFLYLVTRALGFRQTTPFEMELQAEVDKFLVLSRLLSLDGMGPQGHLHHCLFEAMTLRPGMGNALAQRYVDANRYAGKYCRYLQSTYHSTTLAKARLYDELYCFYRLPQPEKVRHIERRGG
jgi:hypothetical protein